MLCLCRPPDDGDAAEPSDAQRTHRDGALPAGPERRSQLPGPGAWLSILTPMAAGLLPVGLLQIVCFRAATALRGSSYQDLLAVDHLQRSC